MVGVEGRGFRHPRADICINQIFEDNTAEDVVIYDREVMAGFLLEPLAAHLRGCQQPAVWDVSFSHSLQSPF